MMIPLPWAAAGLASFAALVWARGKTGPFAVSESEVGEAIRDLCETLEAVPNDVSVSQLATLAADAMAPGMTWPPRPLASRAQKAAWVLIKEWSREVVERAASQGKSVCELVKPKTATLQLLLNTVPATPLSPPGGTPPGQIGGLAGGPSNIADTPTEGRWSRPLENGNAGLLTNVGFAYGVPSGASRLYASKVVNNHPLNRAHAKFRASNDGFELVQYGPAILSFDGSGSPIYFPPASEALP